MYSLVPVGGFEVVHAGFSTDVYYWTGLDGGL